MNKMRIGIDIDDTITRAPEFFSFLTHAVKRDGGEVHIISSRSHSPEVLELTRKELNEYDIVFDNLYLFPYSSEEAANFCPHKELDWYKKWLWQKAAYCQKHKVDVYFDDDEKVADLFQRYLPKVKFFKAGKEEICEEGERNSHPKRDGSRVSDVPPKGTVPFSTIKGIISD